MPPARPGAEHAGRAAGDADFTHPVTGQHYSAYIDVDAWIDHHILNTLAKNVDALAKAARGCTWPVMVAGAGQAPSSVTALGPLGAETVAEWMQRASIYALPARYEPFGLSVLEAAMAGAAPPSPSCAKPPTPPEPWASTSTG